jgi:hypothetical protein
LLKEHAEDSLDTHPHRLLLLTERLLLDCAGAGDGRDKDAPPRVNPIGKVILPCQRKGPDHCLRSRRRPQADADAAEVVRRVENFKSILAPGGPKVRCDM